MKINEALLSPYTKELKDSLCIKGVQIEKLVPNLSNKSRYIVHYESLKMYIALGMKLKKIHRGIEFYQSPWLKKYIEKNTEERKKATSEFDKNFFKLMNNSVFGKSMENLRARVSVHLVNSVKKLHKVVAKPSFHSFKIFNKHLTAVHLKKSELYLNKPSYIGFCILELSKTLIYDFHYNYIKPRYGENAILLFTDTDSLCYNIKTRDVYDDWSQDLALFDTSDYPKSHKLYRLENKKILGKMKDEMNGKIILEFVGLRPKMYSIKLENSEKKTAKGVSKSTIKKKLKHDMYKKCLFEKRKISAKMHYIRSDCHNIYSVEVNKIALSPFDDKRYVLPNGTDTLALGHYHTEK